MVEQLATDPGAWNIIWWTVLLVVVGSAIFWGLSTLFLNHRAGDGSGGRGDPPAERRS